MQPLKAAPPEQPGDQLLLVLVLEVVEAEEEVGVAVVGGAARLGGPKEELAGIGIGTMHGGIGRWIVVVDVEGKVDTRFVQPLKAAHPETPGSCLLQLLVIIRLEIAFIGCTVRRLPALISKLWHEPSTSAYFSLAVCDSMK